MKERVKQYLEYCEFRRTLDCKTLKAYRIDLRQFFEMMKSDKPGKTEIENYIMELHKKYKQKTVKRKIASIKAFYNYLEEEEYIRETPFRKIKVKFQETLVLPRIIPRDEIEKMLNFMYEYGRKCTDETSRRFWLRDISVVEVFFAIGARVHEVSNITIDCVNLNNGLIRIMGKGGKERYIQIGEPAVIELLKMYYQKNELAIMASGFFFINQRGSRFTEQSIRGMLKKYAKQADIKRNITPHMFRHSFATYLIEEEVDISCVQQILGHSSINTTQIYIHVAAARQAEVLKSKHPRNQMKIMSVL